MARKHVFTFNTLNFKVRLSLILVAVIPLVVYLILNNISVTNNFGQLEKRDIVSKVQSASGVLRSKTIDMQRMAKDYAIWDEAYDKIQEKDTEWFIENFSGWLPESQGLDLTVVVNRSSEIIDGFGVEDNDYSGLLNDTTIKDVINGRYDGKRDQYPNGFKVVKGDLYFIGACPILPIDYSKPSRGAVIFGKKVIPKVLQDLESELGCRLSVSFADKIITNDNEYDRIGKFYKEAMIDKSENNTWVESSEITGSTFMNDISGEQFGLLFVSSSRQTFLSTLNLIQINATLVLAISIIVIIILSFKLRDIIILPINNLKGQIRKMVQKNTLEHLYPEGPEEVKELAEAFNHLTDSIHSQKKENKNLRALTITDGLTKLYNHRYLFEYFQDKISSGCEQIGILFCDIDHFKTINDIKGHISGDLVLCEVAGIIKEVVKDRGAAFRYGGEEFVIILENCTSSEAYYAAERIRLKVRGSESVQQFLALLPVTVSIGISSYPDDAPDIESLIDKSDKAMYFGKQNGRDQCNIYSLKLEKFLLKSTDESGRQEMLLNSVYTLVAAIDAKDTYTEKHSEFVTTYALLLAEKLRLKNHDRQILKIGGLLHDCGKIGIPDHIIHKTGPLTGEEWRVVKNHTTLGSNIIKFIIKTPEIESCVRCHHERWDGKGYPDGLRGASIPFHARIISIADSYHAMISDRPYRRALSLAEALEEIKRNRGTQFDPEIADAFIQAVKELDNRKSQYFNS